jgi:large subunit ribosomal protein L21
MYAIVKNSGRQFKVQKGATIRIDRSGAEKGSVISFDDVSFYTDKDQTLVGTPKLENVKITGEILGEEKGPKVLVFKFKRRKGYRRKQGHRQKYTKVKITDISVV